ncbi:MAG: HEAT repeat domain-containing protein, partial [Planctomycetes bacterium]|nr:HEAT repeat domain-containing protein [Planctomycetota bacterium]
MRRIRLDSLLAAAVVCIVAGTSHAGEAELLATLDSDSPLKAKVDACRQLARVATAKSVPTLAGLLSNPKLSHMARYAMESIPDPSVDEALRRAAGKLTGRLLVGVIGSIGVRRDAKAVGLLAGLLGSNDAEVARAAARALGNIADAGAAKALTEALAKAPADRRSAVCEGLLRCAEQLAGGKRLDQAVQ